MLLEFLYSWVLLMFGNTLGLIHTLPQENPLVCIWTSPPTERPVKNIGRSGKAPNQPHLLRHLPFVVFYCALDWGTFWACVFHFRGFDSTFLWHYFSISFPFLGYEFLKISQIYNFYKTYTNLQLLFFPNLVSFGTIFWNPFQDVWSYQRHKMVGLNVDLMTL